MDLRASVAARDGLLLSAERAAASSWGPVSAASGSSTGALAVGAALTVTDGAADAVGSTDGAALTDGAADTDSVGATVGTLADGSGCSSYEATGVGAGVGTGSAVATGVGLVGVLVATRMNAAIPITAATPTIAS